jgi:hypothetical protein
MCNHYDEERGSVASKEQNQGRVQVTGTMGLPDAGLGLGLGHELAPANVSFTWLGL